ncbi:TPA: hypothetical protein HA239_05260 [Candidatus Woesearchaeota archaeon]|nr:hypothetical protein QT06_C0001G0289 [archaeon GW2011_AR15]MBS3103609.1 hypothetical protein [Candidatus Woesearchaeota archaeon]HIH41791.1 hypothetical protein [Candidatus Woesearchaeota archaeon]
MGHIFCRLRNVSVSDIRARLKADEKEHAKYGLYLENVWQNADNPDEVLFLFRAYDLKKARDFIEAKHKETLEQNPEANLPQMIFLE